MEPKIYRGYGALQIGRWSCENSDYFITGCLQRPLTGLTHDAVGNAVRAKLHELESTGCWKLRTYVLMPDHFHLLFTLGTTTNLSDAIRRFKGPLTPLFREHRLSWQKNVFDHRLRSVDELLPTFLYIFLNPYREGLLAAGEKWPWFYCAPEDWEWFGGMTNESVPFPEWLN